MRGCRLREASACHFAADGLSRIIRLALLATVAIACGGDTGPDRQTGAAALSVSPTDLTLLVGGHGSLAALVTDADGIPLTNASVSWMSLTPGIASVSGGTVAGVSAGTTMVIASSGGKSDTAAVTVISPGGVTLEIVPSAATIHVGETVQFAAAAHHTDGTIAPLPVVQWASSNPAVALAPLGLAVGISPGSSVITATAGAGLTASADLDVVPAALACDGIEMIEQWSLDLSYEYAEVLLTAENKQVSVGHAGDLTATLLPAGGQVPAVQWSGLLDGSSSMNDRVVDFNSTPNVVETLIGDGLPATGVGQSRFQLQVNLAACTYELTVTPFVHVVNTISGTSTTTEEGDVPVGTLTSAGNLGAWRTLTIASLGEEFEAHSIMSVGTRVGLSNYFPFGTGQLLWVGGDLAAKGSATVSFTIKAE